MYAMNQKMIFMEFDKQKQQVDVYDNGMGLAKSTSN